jgi:hypothetical protein
MSELAHVRRVDADADGDVDLLGLGVVVLLGVGVGLVDVLGVLVTEAVGDGFGEADEALRKIRW